MFFWSKTKLKKKLKTNDTKASLQACHNPIYPEFSDDILNPTTKSKRTFSFSPCFIEGSLCLEAAFSLSFFLLFFVNIFSLIFLYTAYLKQLEEVQEKGKKYAMYGYLGQQTGGSENLIELRDLVPIKSFFSFLGYEGGNIVVTCTVKPWTGYESLQGLSLEEGEEMVYMTEYGTVYHRQRACTHLSLSIRVVSNQELRSHYTSYDACEICCKNTIQEGIPIAAYITEQGERYHRSVNCRGLKRRIKCIPISEVQGIPECSKCG